MKVLLIEDRIERKRQFMEGGFTTSLEAFGFLKELDAQNFSDLKSKLGAKDASDLKIYDLILMHKSAFSSNEYDIIVALGIPLVVFSGGISQSFFTEVPGPCLHINSKDFYSEKLIEFLNYIQTKDEIELLILQFGKKWKLNLLLNTRDNLYQLFYRNLNKDLYPEDFDMIFYEKSKDVIESEVLISQIQVIRSKGIRASEKERIESIKKELDRIVKVEIANSL